MTDQADEIYEDVRAFHGDRFVSMFDRKAEEEIQSAIQLHKLMTEEEKDILLRVRDDFPALVEHIAKVRARVGLV